MSLPEGKQLSITTMTCPDGHSMKHNTTSSRSLSGIEQRQVNSREFLCDLSSDACAFTDCGQIGTTGTFADVEDCNVVIEQLSLLSSNTIPGADTLSFAVPPKSQTVFSVGTCALAFFNDSEVGLEYDVCPLALESWGNLVLTTCVTSSHTLSGECFGPQDAYVVQLLGFPVDFLCPPVG
ncbi:hypothetical protein BT96DRAFT_974668 [Gymnopus androsaceus JB14]|uniref:Uncharacterized protein n=1 Tax=Gymnopus androsaceus JB14 TaxID=1447944 RepID=A0A6A4HR30_9AGAR|nr:hypothetical protein BT96DRAFT_974668 [Gymnopus androsaceus JB14]